MQRDLIETEESEKKHKNSKQRKKKKQKRKEKSKPPCLTESETESKPIKTDGIREVSSMGEVICCAAEATEATRNVGEVCSPALAKNALDTPLREQSVFTFEELELLAEKANQMVLTRQFAFQEPSLRVVCQQAESAG